MSRTGGTSSPGSPPERLRIPANADRPDTVLAGLTARQLAILAPAAAGLWVAYLATRHVLPLEVFAALAAPVAVAAAVLAFARRDGLGADRLALAAARQALGPRRLVTAPEGVRPPPAWAGIEAGSVPRALRLPARRIGDDGILDLGSDGAALICRASAAGFALRTPAEQHALVGAFARYLNGLSGPIQIVATAEPVDLSALVADLRAGAGGLAHPALEAAARDHASFLAALDAQGVLLARQVLVVLREPAGEAATAAARLQRAAGEAAAALAGAGVSLVSLDGPAAAAVLSAAADPFGAPRPAGLSAPGAVVTGRLS